MKKMREMVIATINFDGDALTVIQNAAGAIFVAVVQIMRALGFNADKIASEKRKILRKKDDILHEGVEYINLGAASNNNEAMCLELQYLPIWLGRINITPAMQKKNPGLIQKLHKYQLGAAEAVSRAFSRESEPQSQEPVSAPDCARKLDEIQRKLDYLCEQFEDFRKQSVPQKEPKVPAETKNDFKMIDVDNAGTAPAIVSNDGVDIDFEKWNEAMFCLCQRVLRYNPRYTTQAELSVDVCNALNITPVGRERWESIAYRDPALRADCEVVLNSAIYAADGNETVGRRLKAMDDAVAGINTARGNQTTLKGGAWLEIYAQMEKDGSLIWESAMPKFEAIQGRKPNAKKEVIAYNDELYTAFMKAAGEVSL